MIARSPYRLRAICLWLAQHGRRRTSAQSSASGRPPWGVRCEATGGSAPPAKRGRAQRDPAPQRPQFELAYQRRELLSFVGAQPRSSSAGFLD